MIFVFLALFSIVLSLSQDGSFLFIQNISINTVNNNCVIESRTFLTSFQCLARCLKNSKCDLIQTDQKACTLLSKYAVYHTDSYSNSSIYYKKNKISEWPTRPYPNYHWPIFDSKLDEVAGDVQFTRFNGISFTADRFGNSNSAARINNGKMHLPSRTYFQGEFTIMAWTKIEQLNNEMSLFSCSDNSGEIVHLSYLGGTGLPYFAIYRGGSAIFLNFAFMNPNQWYHLVFGFRNSNAFVYLNGTLNAQVSSHAPNAVVRTECFIGGDVTEAVADDFKIFNRALTDTEVMNHFLM